MLTIITNQLSKLLPTNHKLQNHISIDPTNFREMYNLFKISKENELCIYDATASKNLKHGQTVRIRDHINNTGTNILIGRQQTLKIDFPDSTNIYSQDQKGIITTCCGKIFDFKKKYPSHYLCHPVTLARSMQINKITGYLYNVRKNH